MKPGRNDPCPCGSGRKYKHCCQAAESQLDAPGALGSTRRQVLGIAAGEALWEVDAVPLPVAIEDGGRHRPVAILVTAAELVIGTSMRDRLSGEHAALAEAIEREIVAAARVVGTFPERLAVRFPELRDPLQARLESSGVQVEVTATPGTEAAARSLIEHLAGIAQWPPISIADSWSAWRVPAATIRELFAAAAEYWRRAPWKIMDDEQAPEATFPSGRIWTVGVMGNAGLEFGLSLYSDPHDLYAIAAAENPRKGMVAFRGRAITLTYEATADLPPGMRVEAHTSGWEIADPRAFPTLLTINTPGGGVTQQEIEELAALLRAIPAFAEAHAEELALERLSPVPAVPLTWADPATALRLRYDGESGWEDIDNDDDKFAISPEDELELRRIARGVLEELGPTADVDSYMRLVTERSEEMVAKIAETRQPEFGGLSVRQLSELTEADWLDDDGPVRLNRTLPLARIAQAEVLHRCRTLLRFARERGGIAATARGNLTVPAIGELEDRLGGSPIVRPEGGVRPPTAIDVRPFQLSCVLLEFSGALVHAKRRFVVTRLGERLLHDESAGELFALLFATCFQSLDLDSLGGPEWPELQEQIAYALYRLSERREGWATPEELLPEIVAAPMMRSAPGSELDTLPALLLERRVLLLLFDFGLMEMEEDSTGVDSSEWRRYRITPLLGEFLTIRP
jgi:hypothetical protein